MGQMREEMIQQLGGQDLLTWSENNADLDVIVLLELGRYCNGSDLSDGRMEHSGGFNVIR